MLCQNDGLLIEMNTGILTNIGEVAHLLIEHKNIVTEYTENLWK